MHQEYTIYILDHFGKYYYVIQFILELFFKKREFRKLFLKKVFNIFGTIEKY